MDMVLLGLLSGIAFGFVIQRIGATDADKMAKAHLMLEGDIPRFMLTAVAFSALGLAGLQAVGVGRMSVLPTSIVATGVAAVIFGIGWGLSGYCPGTTWAAAGEGRLDAVFALLGGFAGTAVFAQFPRNPDTAFVPAHEHGPAFPRGLAGRTNHRGRRDLFRLRVFRVRHREGLGTKCGGKLKCIRCWLE